MASGDLALPIGHVPSTAAAAPLISVFQHRPFRQPVDLADAADFSDGLELWLDDDGSSPALFAMFDGELLFIAADTPGKPNQIILQVSVGSQRRIDSIAGMTEPGPVTVTYDNVDEVVVSDALRILLVNAYNAALADANAARWHPAMRGIYLGARLKDQIDAAVALLYTVDDAVRTIVNLFMGGADAVLSVAAGDAIGFAADPLATDPAPGAADCPFVATAKRLTIITQEYASNTLNPSWYLWRLLGNANDAVAANRFIQVLTRAPRQADDSFDHPLLNAIALELDVTVLPRVFVNTLMPGQVAPTDVLLFPLGALSAWHYQDSGAASSSIEWHQTNDPALTFEVQSRGAAALPATAATVAQQNLIRAVWANWGADINTICAELQFPAELIVASIAHESGGTSRILRLEPLNAARRAMLAAAGVAASVVADYDTLTGLAGRGSIAVPNPWNGAAQINAVSPLTWDQLLDIVDAVPDRMSPGLMQTLVDTASGNRSIGWLRMSYANVAGTFGVAALPARSRDWFDWLLDGRQSILAGTAYHKWNYCNRQTRMDAPRVGAAYNAGALRQMAFWDPPANVNPNPWHLYYYTSTYPEHMAQYYNAIEAEFNAGSNGAARFWRNR